MNLKTLNDRLVTLESCDKEQKLVVWWEGDGETREEAPKRCGVQDGDSLTVIRVVYDG